MKRYLFDSGAMSVFLDRRGPLVDRVRHERKNGNRIGTAIPIVAELFYGLHFSSTRDKNLIRLRRGISELIVWPFDLAAAEEYGRIGFELRKLGRPMQVVDVMVAAIAMTLGNCTVVTTDHDLESVPKLSVENWTVS
jgi:tRNA(fMet)-specific endonuclease VapC